MKVFCVKAEPVSGDGPPAAAIVVAHDAHQAVVLLRKDVNFSGYHLPPAEMVPYEAAPEDVRRVLGETAAHEIGVYRFAVLEPEVLHRAGTPPAAL
jgi:hypothetical protein